MYYPFEKTWDKESYSLILKKYYDIAKDYVFVDPFYLSFAIFLVHGDQFDSNIHCITEILEMHKEQYTWQKILHQFFKRHSKIPIQKLIMLPLYKYEEICLSHDKNSMRLLYTMPFEKTEDFAQEKESGVHCYLCVKDKYKKSILEIKDYENFYFQVFFDFDQYKIYFYEKPFSLRNHGFTQVLSCSEELCNAYNSSFPVIRTKTLNYKELLKEEILTRMQKEIWRYIGFYKNSYLFSPFFNSFHYDRKLKGFIFYLPPGSQKTLTIIEILKTLQIKALIVTEWVDHWKSHYSELECVKYNEFNDLKDKSDFIIFDNPPSKENDKLIIPRNSFRLIITNEIKGKMKKLLPLLGITTQQYKENNLMGYVIEKNLVVSFDLSLIKKSKQIYHLLTTDFIELKKILRMCSDSLLTFELLNQNDLSKIWDTINENNGKITKTFLKKSNLPRTLKKSKFSSENEKMCSICEKNDKTTMLGCLHEICQTCLKKLVELKCPFCRKSINFVVSNELFEFPNVKMERIYQFVEKHKDEKNLIIVKEELDFEFLKNKFKETCLLVKTESFTEDYELIRKSEKNIVIWFTRYPERINYSEYSNIIFGFLPLDENLQFRKFSSFVEKTKIHYYIYKNAFEGLLFKKRKDLIKSKKELIKLYLQD